MYERTYKAKVLAQDAPEEKKRRKRLPLKRILWIFLTLVFIAGVAVLIRLPAFQVRNIEVSGTEVTDPEEVSLFVKSQTEGKHLYFFPRSSMLLVPTTTIGRRLQTQFPRFASVDVRRKGVNSLSVTVTEHQGAYLWCESDESCFFMTKEGVVFAEAPFFSGDAYERVFVGEKKNLPFEPLSTEQLEMINVLRSRLPTIGIMPKEYRLISDHQFDIAFSHFGSSSKLLFDHSADLDKTIEDLATGLATDPLKSKFNNPNSELEYLDARFANKVIYKFANDAQ